jgi:hypothetical protein
VTNVYEWYVFDAVIFDRLFAQDKKLVQLFTDFQGGRLADTKTEFFYKEIADPAIAKATDELEYTWWDLRKQEKNLRNTDRKDDNRLIPTYKIFSAEHLLKLPFANDSNSLDRRFYTELLHILGLNETKEKGKKLIERNAKDSRHGGSLLENAILQLDSLDKLSRVPQVSQYGDTRDERLFGVGLELCITWVNRIVFMKLLESRLIGYDKGDKRHAFLTQKLLPNYDELNKLFFQVLARKSNERTELVKEVFSQVPYLNSSLFEPTEMEHQTLLISNLEDELTVPLHSATVLKDEKGRKLKGQLDALTYLVRFLDAYDFSSDGGEEIQEENKSLINASVLGLIFEKINGYKDGSFFTPGFITMYMCRETIRKAALQKFKEAKGWDCRNLDELYEKIEDRAEANRIINEIRICDPAVGSGHFLVSALNELIAVKHDLKILSDRNGRRLKEYAIEVVSDELVVTDEDGELFDYFPGNPEKHRVQEALFHEKQILIENCLFGVDINPNSVKICRLRLWIELLKNAYYKSDGELETLPNIDINIKTGNSLISRFELEASLAKALRKSKWNIDGYRVAVQTYRNAENKEQKREMENLIAEIKSDFSTTIETKFIKSLSKARGSVEQIATDINTRRQWGESLRGMTKELETATKKLKKLEAERYEIESSKIFQNAFEWRFEFPEVLDAKGNFTGFDAVIGNPPYIRQEELKDIKPYLSEQYATYAGTADLYVYFVERAMLILKEGGAMSYIIPNKWMRAGYGKALRGFLQNTRLTKITDFGDLPVFEEATTYPCILEAEKAPPHAQFQAAEVATLNYADGRDFSHHLTHFDVMTSELRNEGWTLVPAEVQRLLAKIRSKGTPLGEYVDGKIYYGIKTGLNEAFVIDRATRDRLIAEDPRSAEVIKPFLAGRDIKRYEQPRSDRFLILFKNGDTKKWFGELNEDKAKHQMQAAFPVVMNWLKPFEAKAKKRYDKGQFWWELRACDYYGEFEEGKILYPDIAKQMSFTYDEHQCFAGNTVYMIITERTWLVGYLNSRLAQFYYRLVSNSIRGGYMRFFSQVLEMIPVPQGELPSLKGACGDAFDHYRNSDESTRGMFEFGIDRAVYDAFGLDQSEIDLIEEFEPENIDGKVLQTGFGNSEYDNENRKTR